jgi:excisionase family DNA binding protein
MEGATMELEHELYKAKEVAALLRLSSTKTFYAWVKRGKAHVIRTPSGNMRIPRAEVQRLLAANVAGGKGVDKHLPHE